MTSSPRPAQDDRTDSNFIAPLTMYFFRSNSTLDSFQRAQEETVIGCHCSVNNFYSFTGFQPQVGKNGYIYYFGGGFRHLYKLIITIAILRFELRQPCKKSQILHGWEKLQTLQFLRFFASARKLQILQLHANLDIIA